MRLVAKPGSTKQDVPPAAIMYLHPLPHFACAGIDSKQPSKFWDVESFQELWYPSANFHSYVTGPASKQEVASLNLLACSRLQNDAPPLPQHVRGGS